MNCTRCNMPLVPEARFCRNCGLPVSAVNPQPASGEVAQANQQDMGDSPAVLSPPWQVQHATPVQPRYPPQVYQPTVAVSPKRDNMPGVVARYASPPSTTKRRKNRLTQVLLIVLAVLLVLALLLVGGWFLLLRPYAHSVAQNEVDSVFTSATNLINPLAVAIVAASHKPVIITENDANNFITSNISQSDPIQQVHLSITPAGLQVQFQTYGLTSTITGVPHVENGQIVMTNVTVQGPTSLIMSPDELTNEVNADLQRVSASLKRPITGLVLKNQQMDVKLG
jgi:hypothetical protein